MLREIVGLCNRLANPRLGPHLMCAVVIDPSKFQPLIVASICGRYYLFEVCCLVCKQDIQKVSNVLDLA